MSGSKDESSVRGKRKGGSSESNHMPVVKSSRQATIMTFQTSGGIV